MQVVVGGKKTQGFVRPSGCRPAASHSRCVEGGRRLFVGRGTSSRRGQTLRVRERAEFGLGLQASRNSAFAPRRMRIAPEHFSDVVRKLRRRLKLPAHKLELERAWKKLLCSMAAPPTRLTL